MRKPDLTKLKPGETFELPTAMVYLHGSAKRRWGGPFRWGVETPAEAIRALDTMKPGFRDYLREHDFQLVRGPRHGGLDLDTDTLDFSIRNSSLHVIPLAKGAGGGRGASVGKVIGGAALVALAIYSGGAAAGAAGGLLGGGTVAGVSASSVGMLGASMIFAGAASMLSPMPKAPRPQEKSEGTRNPSFLFDGPSMVMEQGRVVPIVYGRQVRVGGVLIASGYVAQDFSPQGNAAATPVPADGEIVIEPITGQPVRFDRQLGKYVYAATGQPTS